MNFPDFSKETLESYRSLCGEVYDKNKNEVKWYQNVADSFREYVTSSMSELLGVPCHKSYDERPCKQNGRGKGLTYKNYVLSGVLPNRYSNEWDKYIFIKTQIYSLDTEEPVFDISIDLNQKAEKNPFSTVCRFPIMIYKERVDESFPKDWDSFGTKMKEHYQKAISELDSVVQLLDSPDDNTNHFFMNANPADWGAEPLSDIEIGVETYYSIWGENGKRREIASFAKSKTGDLIIGYETGNTQAVVAVMEITRKDEEFVYFKKIESIAPDQRSNKKRLIEDPLLSMIPCLKGTTMGSLFDLTKVQYDRILSLAMDNYTISGKPSLQNITHNMILFGPPGTGKTFHTLNHALEIIDGVCPEDREAARLRYDELVHKRQIVFTTFHQSLCYEDFIEGIKPVLENRSSGISYRIESGIFKRIVEDADGNSDTPFVLIIDEINRGNVAQIFGELITLIEDDKRLGSKEGQTATLPYSKTKFGVPDNLFIIGTMNTADRSVEALDTALRRRFNFIEMMPDYSLPQLQLKLSDILNMTADYTLADMLWTINRRIRIIKDREHQIGHSYFLNYPQEQEKRAEWLKSVFKNKIVPLLQEYFFGDFGQIKAVLGEKFVNKESLSKELLASDYDIDEYDKYDVLSDGQWNAIDMVGAIESMKIVKRQ